MMSFNGPLRQFDRNHACISHICSSVISGIVLAGLMSLSALAADKPPLSPDILAPTSTSSKISAIIEFGLAAIDSALERKIPRRLATFEDDGRSCWNRR